MVLHGPLYLQHFGGVPQIVVPDNTRTVTTKCSYYEPELNRRFFSLADMREALFGLLEDVNTKLFQKLPGFRPSTFLDIEKPALRPLPEKQYGLAYFTKAKVNLDCHLEMRES